MPKIATYEPYQTRTGAVRQPRATATGVDFSPLVRGASNVATAALNLQKRFDTTAAEEALVAFERDKNNLLFNPENGYYNSQGKNAYDQAPLVMQSMNELKKQYGKDLSTGSREMFNRAADAHITKSQTDVMRHSAKGLKVWELGTIESQVENSVENASLYWNSPKDLQIALLNGEAAIHESAKISGISDQLKNEKLQSFRSSFASASIEAAAAKSSEEAQKLYSEMDKKKLLEGPDRIRLKNIIEQKKKSEDVQMTANMANTKATNLVSQYDSRVDIQAQVNKIKDPELRKATMSESMRLFDQKLKAESEERGQIFEDVEEFIMNGGSAQKYQAQNPDQWMKLSPKQKKSLGKNAAVESDMNLFSDLMLLPKEKLAKIDPNDYNDRLAKTERGKLISAVKSARGEASDSEKADSQVGRSRTAETTAAVEQVFGHKSKWNNDKRKQANAFYALVDSEVRFRENELDRKLTSAEYTDVLAGLTREVVQKNQYWFDTEKSFTDIPAEDVQILSNQLRAKGIPVTTDNLLKLYEQASKPGKSEAVTQDAIEIFPTKGL